MAEEQEVKTSESNATEQELEEKEPEKHDKDSKDLKTSTPTKPKKKEKPEPEEDESSDEEEQLGSLERPVEILESKRERKSVSRLSFTPSEETKKSKFDFTQGKGVKLGDIDRSRYELDQVTSDELKPLHRLIYGREGKSSEIKKNIRAFCGYPFEVDSEEYEKKKWGLEKFTNQGLKRMCEIFAIDHTGKRKYSQYERNYELDELKERVMKFMMEPYDAGMKVPQKAEKTEKPKKRKKPKKDKEEKSTKKKAKSKQKADNEEDEEDGEDDEEKPPKKKRKTESNPKSKPKDKKKTTAVKLPTPKKKKKADEKPKKSTPKKTPTKKAKKEEASDSDSDDEPLVKIAKPEPPTDEAIEDVIKEILDGADLETVTMKNVCNQVYEKFPGHDITDRKPFIKETVKRIIS